MLGPRSIAYAENQKPNSVAVAGRSSVGTSLLRGHGEIDQALDVRVGVDVLLERPRTLHRVCRHLDQVQIENSIDTESDILQNSLTAPLHTSTGK